MSGIFGAVCKENCSELVLYGTDYHSHLGTEFGGMAILGENFSRQIHSISQSQFKSKFYTDYLNMKGTMGLGVISDSDEQPVYIKSKLGAFCLITNGLIENKGKLVSEVLEKGMSFSELKNKNINSTELIAKLVTQGEDIVRGIEKVFDTIEGACSMLLLHRDGLFAARDRFGHSTLIIGKRDNDYVVTTESAALANLDFEVVKELMPGEIVLINEKGISQMSEPNSSCKICSFLWIYTAFPGSNHEGINTEIVRERCGKCLAKRDKDLNIDLVAGVPDSGMGHAIGYAIESKVPIRRALVKYTPGYGRSYTPPSQTGCVIIHSL